MRAIAARAATMHLLIEYSTAYTARARSGRPSEEEGRSPRSPIRGRGPERLIATPPSPPLRGPTGFEGGGGGHLVPQ